MDYFASLIDFFFSLKKHKKLPFVTLEKLVLGGALIFVRARQSSTLAPYPAFKNSRLHTHLHSLPLMSGNAPHMHSL